MAEHPAVCFIPSTWTPTAESVNALPEPLRRHIHDLETDHDPAGIARDNTQLKQENDWLRVECANLATRAALCDAAMKALDHFNFPDMPGKFQDDADSCTEAIIVDAHVQEARRVIAKAKALGLFHTSE